jgi:polyhydroxybutyrate depolymerase
MKKIYFLFLILIPFISKSQTTVLDSFVHNGIMRTYSFYVPAAYNGTKAYPLVLNLHGYSSAGWQQAFYGDFKPIADTAEFIVVHPEGTTVPTTTNQFWNVGFFPSNIDDVGFLENVIDTISAAYNINQGRIYSTGMSNGGYMSYHLACNSDRFAAIASVTGSMTTSTASTCNPSRPTPVMQIHGTADATVPYGGNAGSLSVDSVVSFWVNYNNCNTNPAFNNVPNISLIDGATAEKYVYSSGNAGSSVELFKVLGGAHTWPGASYIIDVTCQDFSASREIWRFFNQYGTATSIESIQSTSKEISVYPNPATNQISLKSELVSGNYSIYDINGRKMTFGKINNELTTLDLNEMNSGIYFLEIESGEKRFYSKFVKI